MKNFAEIITFNEFNRIRDQLGVIVCTSGGYDPIHPGHISSIVDSRSYGDTLVVIVNGDDFLTRKKGKPFMDLKTRCHIVSALRGVDYVIAFEIKNDDTVIEALKQIKPHIFTKGGDRVDKYSIPEWNICNQLGIKIITGVGLPKLWSSSEIVKNFENR